MRMTQLFGRTFRDAPSDVEMPSHQLLLRAGFIRQLSAGIFSYLPLAKRSLTKIENIMRAEINAIGGQEVTMPVVHPAEIWQQTGRWYKIGSEMGRFKDKNERDMVLSMTHEEVIATLARDEVHSYRQLPLLLYHIQTKWRDDPRPRAGLIRAREFTMKDSYSLDKDQAGLDKQYEAHYQAYHRIFKRCALPVTAVKSDTGMMGGKTAHEFMYLTQVGEDTLMICDHCGYSANRQIALHKKQPHTDDLRLAIEKVATPACKTIDDLAQYLNIPTYKTAKAVFLIATRVQGTERKEQFVFTVVRGDMDVNETKLASILQAVELRPATDTEIRAVEAEPGYASPVGLKNVLVVVDDLIPLSTNLISGANIEGYHLRNVNYGRDYAADIVADITLVNEGDRCIECGNPLKSVRGVEVGNIFKLGTWISEAAGCYFLDSEGNSQPIVMGSYGIGSGRLLACIAEEHHDEYGLILPVTVAPYQVQLVLLPSKAEQESQGIVSAADDLYHTLQNTNIEVLFDDRSESPGIKFNDADLIGNPIRLTVSERSLKNGGVEFKRRDFPEKTIIPIENVIPTVIDEIKSLENITHS
ncbi:MAG: proline--tRNA ligase [Anaerolineales bacterium]|nr:proline--tRNA ligase [Anaerolineae bacterium]PWB50860.1 MAG: proline--tRNA ligase [Anaerolineales bacterium]